MSSVSIDRQIFDANIFFILGKGEDNGIIRELQTFVGGGLPTSVDKEKRAWLSKNNELQNKVSDLISRLQMVISIRQVASAKRRAVLLNSNMVKSTKYTTSKDRENELVAADDVYADNVGVIDNLNILVKFLESNLWLLRNGFNKIPW